MGGKLKSTTYMETNMVSLSRGILIVQLLFIICEMTAWAPNFRPGGEFFNRILNSQFFTEWFTLYTIPQFNVFTAFLRLHYYRMQ